MKDTNELRMLFLKHVGSRGDFEDFRSRSEIWVIGRILGAV